MVKISLQNPHQKPQPAEGRPSAGRRPAFGRPSARPSPKFTKNLTYENRKTGTKPIEMNRILMKICMSFSFGVPLKTPPIRSMKNPGVNCFLGGEGSGHPPPLPLLAPIAPLWSAAEAQPLNNHSSAPRSAQELLTPEHERSR